jgi:hypothetical protein
MNAVTRVKAVSTVRVPWSLNVTWPDGGKDRGDLTGLIHRSRHFRVFHAPALVSGGGRS